MLTTLTLMTMTAVLANDTLRAHTLRLLSSAYMWLLSSVFGDEPIQALNVATVEPTDTDEYTDGIYELCLNGYRRIEWFSGSKVRNLLAYGYTVAYVV
jgi:hypothetical protein